MSTTWVVAADAGRTRIFEMTQGAKQFRAIDELVNPDALQCAHPHGLNADGRLHLVAEPRQVRHGIEAYSQQVTRYLERARAQHRYHRLCVIAQPKLLALLMATLGRETRELVHEQIPKDLSGYEGRDILAYLRQREVG